ncbi:hypothetical protein L798_02305 [Zootermopsis nevadensis]|uniref:Uncharacterized protein n=1 Tax=Zootermopsis nevadensis TaxID=136037 RepID=A0A067QIN5_ZOONE|nr:hypothetical protein L798_02305 [Zootermopsis nevadensis]
MIDPSYPDVATASPDSKVETVVSKIISSISTVPGRITGAYCDDGKNQDTRTGFEGYVTPGFPINYRIHSLFLENTEEVRLKFQGSGHGNLRTCVSRDQGSIGTNCIEVKDLEEAVLKIPSPCAGYPYQCPPAYLTVTVTRTLTRCAGTHNSTTTEFRCSGKLFEQRVAVVNKLCILHSFLPVEGGEKLPPIHDQLLTASCTEDMTAVLLSFK